MYKPGRLTALENPSCRLSRHWCAFHCVYRTCVFVSSASVCHTEWSRTHLQSSLRYSKIIHSHDVDRRLSEVLRTVRCIWINFVLLTNSKLLLFLILHILHIEYLNWKKKCKFLYLYGEACINTFTIARFNVYVWINWIDISRKTDSSRDVPRIILLTDKCISYNKRWISASHAGSFARDRLIIKCS